MRMRALGVAVGVLICAAAVRGATEIPDVKSAEELAKLPVIHVGNGWDVQLGLAEPGPIEGPWKFLVCRAARADQSKPRAFEEKRASGTLLGPVTYKCDWNGRPLALNAFGVPATMEQSKGPLVYVGTVLLSRDGQCTLKVNAPGGVVLAERTLEVKEPAPCWWGEFSGRRRGVEMARLRGVPEAINDVVPHAASVIVPLPWQQDAMARLPGEKDSLGALRVSVRNGVITVDSDEPMVYPTVGYTAARFWVNNRPVGLPLREPPQQYDRFGGGMMSVTKQFDVALDLPAVLGTLAVGDRVALQVLYCPAGTGPVYAGRQVGEGIVRFQGVSRFLISNRVEFIVTPEMLAARGASTRPAEQR